MWTILNFRGRRKTKKKKKTTWDICEWTPDIDFERDMSIGLGPAFGDGHTDRQTDRETDTQTFF